MAEPNIDKLKVLRDTALLTAQFIQNLYADAKWYFDKFGVDLTTDPDLNGEISNINGLSGQVLANAGGIKQKVANDTKSQTGLH